MTYQEAKKLCTGRCKDGRKLCNNTYLERRGDDFAVKLHWTDVVTIHKDGSYTLDSNGWHSVTTKERINSNIPWPACLFQRDFVWYVSGSGFHKKSETRTEFQDGIRLVPKNGGFEIVAPAL